jgi:hypothetical protein
LCGRKLNKKIIVDMKKVIHNTDIQRILSNFHPKYTHDNKCLKNKFRQVLQHKQIIFKII